MVPGRLQLFVFTGQTPSKTFHSIRCELYTEEKGFVLLNTQEIILMVSSNYFLQCLVLKKATAMLQEARIWEETSFNKQQPVLCVTPIPLKPPGLPTWSRPLLSTEAFALASHGLHVTNFYCSTQLLQFTQPDYLLVRQAIIGTFHFHQLQRNVDN